MDDLYQWTYTTSRSNLQRMMTWLRTIALQNNSDVILWKLFKAGAEHSEIVLPRLPQIVGLLNLSHLAGQSWVAAGVLVLQCGRCKRRVGRNDLWPYSMTTSGQSALIAQTALASCDMLCLDCILIEIQIGFRHPQCRGRSSHRQRTTWKYSFHTNRRENLSTIIFRKHFGW